MVFFEWKLKVYQLFIFCRFCLSFLAKLLTSMINALKENYILYFDPLPPHCSWIHWKGRCQQQERSPVLSLHRTTVVILTVLISAGHCAIKTQLLAKVMVFVLNFSKGAYLRGFFMHLDIKHARILRVSWHVEPCMQIPISITYWRERWVPGKCLFFNVTLLVCSIKIYVVHFF